MLTLQFEAFQLSFIKQCALFYNGLLIFFWGFLLKHVKWFLLVEVMSV